MVSKRKVSLLAITIFPFMLGCASYISPDLIYKLQDDVREVKKDVSELKGEKGTEGGAAVSGDAELQLRKEIASIKADMESLRGEISTFQGFIDETKYQMKQDQLMVEEKLRESERRLFELEGKLEASRGPEAVTQGGVSRPPQTAPPAVVAPPRKEKEPVEQVYIPKREAPVPSKSAVKTPEDLYDYGLGLIKANKFGEARRSLDEFANSYPDHRLMPNVYYWRGETFYAEKDFESAAITFQEVIDRFPDSPKAPDSLYKQGLCFFNMRDPISARAAFNLLLSKYPASNAAGKAKIKLNELDEKGG
ncbi:MAG: tol-pal system protein YbgF [Deltaproteobacteria bacterium]|nr:tol-pal system protein YbgF [Deltaproteobacteria bacterium]NIS77074.1 tol-pal system protein YbgF [Deltaproteobacteria bacterium]